jgi:hypothetical protein
MNPPGGLKPASGGFLEQEQDLSATDIERAEAPVLQHDRKLEQGGIKRPGALELAHVE